MKSKKRMFCVLIPYVLLTFALFAQTPSGITWKFQSGDDPAWSAVDFNDSGWKDIQTGMVWERQGNEALDGYAWYRGYVVISSSLKPKAEKQKGFLLKLGKLDYADVTYFNGAFAGKTGDFPPTYECQWDKEREYSIPLSLVRWDKPNVIAVRVYDAGGDGGLWGSPAVFTLRGLADLFKIGVDIREKDHVFQGAVKRTIPAFVKNGSDETLEGKLALSVTTDFKAPVLDVSKPLKSSKRYEKTVAFEIPVLEPGFYLAEAVFTSPLHAARHRFAFAVDPEKVISPPDPPKDVADFWKRARKELEAVDPQIRLIRKDSLCTANRDVYLVEMRSLGNVLVRGWYSVPKKPGRYPAFLHVQGYSSDMQPSSIVQDSDFRDYFKTAAWPANEFTAYVSSRPGTTWDAVFSVLAYFDIKNLAPWIKAPVFMSIGLLDDVCPPHTNFAAYNNLSVPREYRVYPYAGHGLPSESYTARMDWVRKQLGMP